MIPKTKSTSTIKKIFQANYPIILIILLALGLRLWGIDHGMPFVYDPDEPTLVVLAGGILGNRDPNPHWFGHPATTLIYMLTVIDILIFLVGLLFGYFKGPEDFRTFYHNDPSILYLSGRVWVALLGVASILILYLIVSKYFSKKAALLSAFFFAIAPLHVDLSKSIRSDVVMTFFLLLAFWFCLKILHEGKPKHYIFAGIFTGLAVATKYPAALMLLTILVAHFLRNGFSVKNFKVLFLCGIAFLFGLFIGSPFLFLDFKSALADLMTEGRAEHLGADSLGYLQKVWFYLKTLADQAVTWPGLIALFVWGFYNFWKKQNIYVLVLSFIIIFILLISIPHLSWERWILPVVPFACILLGTLIASIADRLSKQAQFNRVAQGIIVVIIVLGISFPILQRSIIDSKTLAGEDTRTLAMEWSMKNIPQGSLILMEIYGPIFDKNAYEFYYVDENGVLVKYNPSDSYKNYFKAPGHIGDLKYLDRVKEAGIDYLILGSMFGRYSEEPEKYNSVINAYEFLISKSSLIFKVEPESGKTNGPTISIYELVGH